MLREACVAHLDSLSKHEPPMAVIKWLEQDNSQSRLIIARLQSGEHLVGSKIVKASTVTIFHSNFSMIIARLGKLGTNLVQIVTSTALSNNFFLRFLSPFMTSVVGQAFDDFLSSPHS